MVFLQQYLYYVLSILGRSLFLMIMMMMNLAFAGPTGLTLKLIHRDSPESPLYQGNLTQQERMERAFQQSIQREQRLLSTWRMKQAVSRNNSTTTNNRKSDIDMVRPGVELYDIYTYMVKLGIGTFSSTGGSPSYYNFYLDTASDLLWLQCDSRRTGVSKKPIYFKQDARRFNRREYSSTYNPLRYDSPNDICRKYADHLRVPVEGNGFCGYRVEYADGASTEGVLATEKLTVSSNEGGTEEIKDFVFGCGYRQIEPHFGKGKGKGQNPIAGILGLGGDQESFIRQLGDRVDNKFEYCFIPWYDKPTTSTFLRFGSDTKIVPRGEDVQTTRTIPVRGETLYYVIMEGILVNGTPVAYPEGSSVFTAKQDGTGGVIFDSGSEATTLSEEVFVPLQVHLVNYFYSRYNITRLQPVGYWKKYDLCFKRPKGFNTTPTITFRFEGRYEGGADFVMDPAAVFDSDKETFCLIIRRSKEEKPFSVILGSTQQGNRRILYDVGKREISWEHDICDYE